MPLRAGLAGLVPASPGPPGTNFVQGIHGADSHFSTGLGDRPDPPAPNIVIMITDGEDNPGSGDPSIAYASGNSDSEIFVVGVGSAIPMSTLNAIASEPDADHVFTAADFDGLLAVIADLVAAVDESLGEGVLIFIESVGRTGPSALSRFCCRQGRVTEIGLLTGQSGQR